MPRERMGFTLAEVMISLALFGLVTTAGVTFLLQQSRSFRLLSERQTRLQNGRFSRDLLRLELRTVGSGVTEDQPMLVVANDSVIAFNSDLTTNLVDSTRFTGAVYVDPYASTAEVSALPMASAITVPGSSPGVRYPLRDYTTVAGTLGQAELVIFQFVRDTTSADRDDIMLVRQVNTAAPEIVATGLRRAGTTPILRYWYDPRRYNNSATALDSVPTAWLPLSKTVAQRGIAPDTGIAVSARIDQVRAVEVTFETGLSRSGQRERVQYMVALPNTAAPRQSRACGRPPIVPASVSAAWNSDSNAVLLSWPRAADDRGGEDDAVRYALWRREIGVSTNWGQPIATLSAVSGMSTYRYRDGGVEVGASRSYRYALAVQDCTPNLSPLANSNDVIVP